MSEESETGYKSEEEKIQELKGIWNRAMSGKGAADVFGRSAKFVVGFRKKYPEYTKYKLYHLLAGSTVEDSSGMELDTSDEELEKFIRSLEE